MRSITSSLETRPQIVGKLTGHFPRSREYSTETVYDGIARDLDLQTFLEKKGLKPLSMPDSFPRPPILCAGCPHRASFYAMKNTLSKNIVYCNDIVSTR